MNWLLGIALIYLVGVWAIWEAVRYIVYSEPLASDPTAMLRLGLVVALFWPFAVLWCLFALLHVALRRCRGPFWRQVP